MMIPKAILFDFDGVVVDSFNAHYHAWNLAYKQLFDLSISEFPKEALTGRAPGKIASYLCQEAGYPERSEALWQIKKEFLNNSNIWPNKINGIERLLKVLKESQIAYGIASNANRNYITSTIDYLQLDFDIFFGVEDYKCAKPDPEPYLKLADRLGIQPTSFDTAIIIEDSLTGVSAGVRSGIKTYGLIGHYSKSQLLDAGCKVTIQSLDELSDQLETKELKDQ